MPTDCPTVCIGNARLDRVPQKSPNQSVFRILRFEELVENLIRGGRFARTFRVDPKTQLEIAVKRGQISSFNRAFTPELE